MSNIKKIKIFVNDSEESKKYYKKLVDRLLENGFSVDDNSFDLAIAIGGDGCFLRMVKECKFNSEIYYVGIHLYLHNNLILYHNLMHYMLFFLLMTTCHYWSMNKY